METCNNRKSAIQGNYRSYSNSNYNCGSKPNNNANMCGVNPAYNRADNRTTSISYAKEDAMEKLGCRFPIAMAYVPWQKWGELYDNEYGLKQGTIFKDLNKVFCGVRH